MGNTKKNLIKLKILIFIFSYIVFLLKVNEAASACFYPSGNLVISCKNMPPFPFCKFFYHKTQKGITASHCLEYYEFIRKRNGGDCNLLYFLRNKYHPLENYTKRFNQQDIGFFNLPFIEFNIEEYSLPITPGHVGLISTDNQLVLTSDYTVKSGKLFARFSVPVKKGLSGSQVLIFPEEQNVSQIGVLSKRADKEGYQIIAEIFEGFDSI